MDGNEFRPENAETFWKQAKPVKVERPSRAMTSLLSVRLPREVLRALTIAARQQEKGPATLARELIEQGLSLEEAAQRGILVRVFARLLEGLPEGHAILRTAAEHEFKSISWSQSLLHFASVGGPPIETQWAKSFWGRPVASERTTPANEPLRK